MWNTAAYIINIFNLHIYWMYSTHVKLNRRLCLFVRSRGCWQEKSCDHWQSKWYEGTDWKEWGVHKRWYKQVICSRKVKNSGRYWGKCFNTFKGKKLFTHKLFSLSPSVHFWPQLFYSFTPHLNNNPKNIANASNLKKHLFKRFPNINSSSKHFGVTRTF